MNLLLLIAAVICFLLDFFKANVGNGRLVALGLALFSASFLVGPAVDLVRRRDSQ